MIQVESPGSVVKANFVATGLFGDGAAAVVMVGDSRGETGPRVLDTRSAVYPDSEGVIGFNVGGTGFEIVLTHWSYLYLPWFFPFVAMALIAPLASDPPPAPAALEPVPLEPLPLEPFPDDDAGPAPAFA